MAFVCFHWCEHFCCKSDWKIFVFDNYVLSEWTWTRKSSRLADESWLTMRTQHGFHIWRTSGTNGHSMAITMKTRWTAIQACPIIFILIHLPQGRFGFINGKVFLVFNYSCFELFLKLFAIFELKFDLKFDLKIEFQLKSQGKKLVSPSFSYLEWIIWAV